MTTSYHNNKFTKRSILHFTFAFLALFTFSLANAQCPPPFDVAGAIKADGPIIINDVGNCTPEAGMIQYDGTTFQGYDGSNWNDLMNASGSTLWSINGNGIHYNNGNVGIGTSSPTSKLHVEDLSLNNNAAALYIDFGTPTSSFEVSGIKTLGEVSGRKGVRWGVYTKSYADHLQTGNSEGSLSAVSTWNAGGGFIGVIGRAGSTDINTFNSTFTSRILGGNFESMPETNVTLDDGIYWIGGTRSAVGGVINNTPVNGAVAAVIGVDEQTGTAQSWASYFEGKGYYSDKVIIGQKNIPTMAGTIDVSNFNLFATGGILTEEVIIKTASDWADYVFEKDYDLKCLEEVENFINTEGHLPNTPTAAEVEENGFSVSEITIMQQEKIEELFLHSIALNKENKTLKNKMVEMERRLLALEER